DGEGGGDGEVESDVGGGVAGDRADRAAVDHHVGDVVVGVGGDGEALVGAVVDDDRAGGADRTVGARRRRHGVLGDGEGGGDGVVGGDVGEGVAGDRADRAAVDHHVGDVVVGVGGDGEALVGAVVDDDRAGGADRTVGARRRRHGVLGDGEGGGD